MVPFCNDDAEPFGVVRACDQKTLDKVWEFMMGDITDGLLPGARREDREAAVARVRR